MNQGKEIGGLADLEAPLLAESSTKPSNDENETFKLDTLLEIQPASLHFEAGVAHVKLLSISSNNVAFKIKATAPKFYTIIPARDTLKPGESTEVIFIFEGTHLREIERHRFLIQAITVGSEVDVSSDRWAHVPKEQIYEHKLDCSCAADDDHDNDDMVGGDDDAQAVSVRKCAPSAGEIASWRPSLCSFLYSALLLSMKSCKQAFSIFFSKPRVKALVTRGTAIAMAAHPVSDGSVIFELLRTANPWWATFYLAFSVLPLIALKYAMNADGQHIHVFMEAFNEVPRIWPFIKKDFAIIFKELKSETLSAREQAYIKVRRLVESILGSLPKLCLAVYIYFRLWFLSNNAYSEHVNPYMLPLNVMLCCFSIYCAVDFFLVYSNLLTGGNVGEFARVMLNLGVGIVDFSILDQLRTCQHVKISLDCSQLQRLGVICLANTVRTSPVLQSCTLLETNLDTLQMTASIRTKFLKSFFLIVAQNVCCLKKFAVEPELDCPPEVWPTLPPAGVEEFWNGQTMLFSKDARYPPSALRSAIEADDEVSIKKALKSTQATTLHLMLAAKWGHWRALRTLLAMDLSIDAGNLLYSAACAGQTTCCKLLLFYQVEAKALGEAMAAAAQRGKAEIVQLLLAAHADPNAETSLGNGALVTCTGDKTTKILLAARADPDWQHSRNNSRLCALAACAQFNDGSRARILVKARADLNLKVNPQLNTPLHVAAVHGSEEVLRILLTARADSNLLTVNGNTPLQSAQKQKQQKCIEALQKASKGVF